MNLGSATIIKITGNAPKILLPQSFYDRAKNIKKLSFGAKEITCNVEKSDTEAIGVSELIIDSLHLPIDLQVHLFLKDDTLKLGPLVGVFTAGFTDSKLRPIGERSLLFAKYLAAGQYAGTIPFVFGVHQIDFEKKVINGLFFTAQGWTEHEVPFPDVIYDRLPNRKSESFHIIKKVKDTLKRKFQIPWYNPGFFDKWTIHELASKSKELKNHFPETILTPSLSDITEIIEKYGGCFLKPVNGSLGYGIYKILKREDQYYCRYRNNVGNRLRRFQSLEKLIEVQFKGNSLSSYICQQPIELLTYKNKPYDFRIHTNKNNEGRWEMSAIAIKTAGTGSVTTHTRFGGKVKALPEVLVPNILAENVTNRLKSFTLSLSNYLEKNVDGYMCEIGYDIGIDTLGEMWVFEANSKPGRSIFSHPDLKANELKTRTMPFEYAIYLVDPSKNQVGLTRLNER
ncbi:hypothetical protein CIB95_00685 [Lottiidibacillus patelloidae]|uniref:ATP-grasp domain-containing protein n=1 Tax=Lottiidibacillus patelloidae TaxID=2670334 RepID=A0A263BWL5_9BACI|nr:YheC/YheD family protein [Lottiidibacillus patelloidae]OZM58129.1 hypothetical protein CIB95_00685 [Lottiidibacillus patelloidae]